MGIRRAQAIRAQITRWMDLWERGLHAGLVGNAEVEGAAREVRANREGRAARGGDKEDEVVARSYHDMVLSSKLLQAVRRATHREGVGYLLPDYQCTKTGRLVAEVLREKHPDMRVPPVENPECAAFEEYGEVPKMVLIDFTEDDVTWVASKLSGAAGALGVEAIELHNWLLYLGCLSE